MKKLITALKFWNKEPVFQPFVSTSPWIANQVREAKFKSNLDYNEIDLNNHYASR